MMFHVYFSSQNNFAPFFLDNFPIKYIHPVLNIHETVKKNIQLRTKICESRLKCVVPRGLELTTLGAVESAVVTLSTLFFFKRITNRAIKIVSCYLFVLLYSILLIRNCV